MGGARETIEAGGDIGRCGADNEAHAANGMIHAYSEPERSFTHFTTGQPGRGSARA